ncbi:hypothetical protein DFH09DRAFT_26818 [Mycena vulgaris]|nr:hypothetical protein DFH09DRAFT_26818 [Mycena vulgaris]
MHLFNLFKAFSATSSRDGQSPGEAEIGAPPSNTSSTRINTSLRKRRRLKRRGAKQSVVWQPEEVIPSPGVHIPETRNKGFRSTPNLLSETYRHPDDAQSRSWSPIPTLQRQSGPTAAYSRLRENLSDAGSWRSYERNRPSLTNSPQGAQLPLDEQRSESMIESPIYGPREEGLFRNEMPYDMVSPLEQLASGWRDSPPYIPRTTSPDLPIHDPHESEMPYDTISPRPKEPAAEWRHSPISRPLYRTVSPESSLHRGYEPRHAPSDPVDPGTYYIIPGGMNVVFQDEDGNEITRVGDFSARRRRISPIIVQDEYGHELYRTSDIEGSSRSKMHPRDEPSRHKSRRAAVEEFGYESRHKARSRSAELHRDRYSEW